LENEKEETLCRGLRAITVFYQRFDRCGRKVEISLGVSQGASHAAAKLLNSGECCLESLPLVDLKVGLVEQTVPILCIGALGKKYRMSDNVSYLQEYGLYHKVLQAAQDIHQETLQLLNLLKLS
jgi:hypothetical protein